MLPQIPECLSAPVSRILKGEPLSSEVILKLLTCEGGLRGLVSLAGLAVAANDRVGKPASFTCGIVNAKSGRCSENCSFCAQSCHHATDIPVYPLVSGRTLFERARKLSDAGVDYMGIVTSGTGPTGRDFEDICDAAAAITAKLPIKLCASLGIIGRSQAEALKKSGFTSYHHNLEIGASYYPRVCSTHGYDLRVETVRNVRRAGLRVCCGGIFGLGESWKDRLELSVALAELDVHSIPINFLIPIKGTPLESTLALSAKEALAVIAAFRLMHPGRDIVICGGRATVLDGWECGVFLSGANGLMVGDYLTAKGASFERDMRLVKGI